MPRREDTRLLIGGGCFIDDMLPEWAAHALVYRSPIAHGHIRALNIDAARSVPGVLAIYTQADLDDAKIGPLRARASVTSIDGQPMIEPERSVLARGEVKYVGHPVAFIVAETPEAAQDAVDAIDADYDELAPVIGTSAAGAVDAPTLWPEAPDNTSFRWQLGNGAETESAIASAPRVVRLTVQHPRLVIAPVEPRGAIGEHDPVTGRFTLTTPSQGTIGLRSAMAESLGCDEEKVRVLTHDVGGSFAVKIWPYPEQLLCLFAARDLGRPVKWISTRAEITLCDAQGRGRTDHATLALDDDGTILAFRVDAEGDLGAYLNAVAPSIFTGGACRTFGHNYRIPALHYRVRCLFTNAPPTDAYRGAGKPESVGTLERVLDHAARELGLDRIELRRRNMVRSDEIPYSTPMGETFDAGDFPGIFDKALAAADWDGFDVRKQATENKGRLRGRAAGIHMHASGGSVAERTQVRALPDGTIRVRTSSQDSGQAHQETLARVVAESLGVSPERVTVEQGDSDTLLVGGSTGGSNLMPVSANTAHRSALVMIDKAREMASEALEAAVQDIEYEAGTLRVGGTDKSISLAELVARLPEEPDTPIGHEQPAGCVGELSFEGLHTTFPNGAYVVEVEVDPETGHTRIDRFAGVDDLGRIIHPESAAGQIMGGLAQAAGEVLMEGMVFDASGQPLSGSMMDYAVPRADQLPTFNLDWAPTESPNSLLGVKGVGELSSIGGPGPISNAVHDALAPLGVSHIDMPLTPEKIWWAINANQGRNPRRR
ncbi:MAG: xanthine dehydrogenase family protein molybdopterin-binding subunit [Alphaproteobacteria bacterium]|nr:xanthine dehydrogenase family protein molybdopterin-binding subunit [Alphaproteobacteria bacterium]